MYYGLFICLLLGSINLHAATPGKIFKCKKVAQSLAENLIETYNEKNNNYEGSENGGSQGPQNHNEVCAALRL